MFYVYANTTRRTMVTNRKPKEMHPASFRVQESGLTEMVFTDSIPYAKKCAKVKQLSIADMFAETIKRVMNNESISSQYII